MKAILSPFVRRALLALCAVLSDAALAASFVPAPGANYVPGEVLVKFKSGVSQAAGAATVAAYGGTVQAALNPAASVLSVKLNPAQSVAQAVASYASDPNVELAQPNYIYHTSAAVVPNDPAFGQQWGFKNTAQTITNAYTQPPASPLYYTINNPGVAGDDMNVTPAWGVITECSTVVVAVVDTGVNYNHQDMVGNMWISATYPNHGYNFTAEGAANDPMDLHGHGTHVAGIIGAVGNNALGVSGVCWKASIMAVRVLDSTGAGTTATIVQGVNFAVSNGAKVINMSLTGTAFDTLYSNAITNAQNNDAVVVVAAGNQASNNDTTAIYPCDFANANIVCVAALDQGYGLATFSNYGATNVDVGAPGTNILSTWAGTNTAISEPLTTGWTLTPATGGWGYMSWKDTAGVSHAGLADPVNWPNGWYPAGANHHVYKNFNLSGYSAATLNFYLSGNVNAGDALTLAINSAGGDPLVSGTTLVSGWLTLNTSFLPIRQSLYNCRTIGCTVGFGLSSAATSTGNIGPMLTVMSIDALATNSTSYDTVDGTSMAAPEVTGLAAMLRAYNPKFTYADTVAAIKNAGRATASLSGKTATGKAVDVMASLAYLNPPAGVTAVVK